MPIHKDLLDRLKNNDQALTTLDVSKQGLNDDDIQQLMNALVINTALTLLNISNNRIGAGGAKALAANTRLTSLDVRDNNISAEAQKQLKQAITRNKLEIVKRRDQFIQALMVLSQDKENHHSQLLWSQLPKELMLHIISLIDFQTQESIGKTTQQMKACAAFIFNHISSMKESLAESVQTKQDFKLIEKIDEGKSYFRFFPPKPQTKAQEEIQERPEKFKKPYK